MSNIEETKESLELRIRAYQAYLSKKSKEDLPSCATFAHEFRHHSDAEFSLHMNAEGVEVEDVICYPPITSLDQQKSGRIDLAALDISEGFGLWLAMGEPAIAPSHTGNVCALYTDYLKSKSEKAAYFSSAHIRFQNLPFVNSNWSPDSDESVEPVKFRWNPKRRDDFFVIRAEGFTHRGSLEKLFERGQHLKHWIRMATVRHALVAAKDYLESLT